MRRIGALALAVVAAACVLAPAMEATAAESTPGPISAQYAVSLNMPHSYAYEQAGGFMFYDGVLENPAGSGTNVSDVTLTIEYHSVSDDLLKSELWTPDCWVLSPGSRTTFRVQFMPPPNYHHFHTIATGQSTSEQPVPISVDGVYAGLGDYGMRWRVVRLTNTSGQTVVGALARVYEVKDSAFWDVMTPFVPYQQRLAIGESADLMVLGLRPLWGSDTSGVVWWAEARVAPLSGSVYRFFNKRTGTHFYTIDPVERDSVVAKLAWLYSYEGPAFNVPKGTGGGSI